MAILPINCALLMVKLRRKGSGKSTMTPKKLNKKCTIAMLSAVSDWETAAKIAVKVVPIFAPKIKGKAFLRDTLRVPTKETVTEVVRELDCKAAVSQMPQFNALSGVPNTKF